MGLSRPTAHVVRYLTISAIAAVAITSGCVLAPPRAVAVPGGGDPSFGWQHLESGSRAHFQSVDAVSSDVVWIVGSRYPPPSPEVLLTIDGGASFIEVTPAPALADDVALQDVEASGPEDALVLSAKEAGAGSRIYRTDDGGVTWAEVFRGTATDDLRCIAMFDRRRGFAVGFGLVGSEVHFRALVTSDGGRSWDSSPDEGMPDRMEGENLGFNADCATATGRKGFFGTIGRVGRVMSSEDFGLSWAATETPLPALGVVGLDFRTNRVGLAMFSGVARTTDGGASWHLVDKSVAPRGLSFDVAWWSDLRGDERSLITEDQRTVFLVSDEGSYVSRDRGKTWVSFDGNQQFWTIDCLRGSTDCWAAGNDGLVARLVVDAA